ncbi:MAG: transporter [Sphingomonas sp.]|uniref:transporter n=1 Tax=Sphingomonas sp. TaxID=28214 RepID=UPI001203A319|nr:transporter [Sphingomonas sp.]THD37701.1 MAG: transporter [Sphingomonas sp.]
MKRLIYAFALLLPGVAHAQDKERDYCPERPGLNTPPCIVDKGHVSVETSVADWTLDDQPDSRTDTVLIGDTKLRIGLTDTIEAQIGWTPYGHVRQRDKTTGIVSNEGAIGDVSLSAKINLMDPDGDKTSIALLPYVTLPVGRSPVGAGDWGAGVLLPLSFSLSDTVSLAATPEVDAAVDQDGRGRHLAYSGTIGLAFKLSEAVTLTGETEVMRDDDPAGHTTQALTALSVGWMATKNLQFDVYGAAGLNKDAPDVELYAGISRRF